MWRERFWQKVDSSGGPDACWLWTGGQFRSGYGAFKLDGKVVRAHRVAYEEIVDEVPDGLLLRHTCEGRYAPGDRTGRRCCNPSHLAPGTVKQNAEDMVAAGRSGVLGGKNAKLSENDVREIRAWVLVGGWLKKDLAEAFGVHPFTIGCVANRKTWKHV